MVRFLTGKGEPPHGEATALAVSAGRHVVRVGEMHPAPRTTLRVTDQPRRSFIRSHLSAAVARRYREVSELTAQPAPHCTISLQA